MQKSKKLIQRTDWKKILFITLFRKRCRRRHKGSKRRGCHVFNKPPLTNNSFGLGLGENQYGLLTIRTSYKITNHAKNGVCLDCAAHKVRITKRHRSSSGHLQDASKYNFNSHRPAINDHTRSISSPLEVSNNLIRTGFKFII